MEPKERSLGLRWRYNWESYSLVTQLFSFERNCVDFQLRNATSYRCARHKVLPLFVVERGQAGRRTGLW